MSDYACVEGAALGAGLGVAVQALPEGQPRILQIFLGVEFVVLVGLYSLQLQPFDRLRESGGLLGLLVFDQGEGLDVGCGQK